VNDRIGSIADLVRFVRADAARYGSDGRWPVRLLRTPQLRWQVRLRVAEFVVTRTWGPPGAALSAFLRWRLQVAGRKLGFTIPVGRFGPGLKIVHWGTIVVSGDAVVGAGCTMHPGTSIGVADGNAPRLGDDVYVGPGAKLFGDIDVGAGTQIGANAVVNRSCAPGAVLVGVPARDIARALPAPRTEPAVAELDAGPPDEGESLANKVGQSASVLLVRRVLTMVLFAGSTMVLARALGVEGFGAYASALAAAQIGIAGADLGFSLVLMRDLGAEGSDGRGLLLAAVRVMSAWCVVLAAILLGLGFARGLDTDGGLALAIFAPGMLFCGLGLLRAVFLVQFRARELARIDLTLAVVQAGAIVGAALAGLGVAGVAAAMVGATTLNTLVVAARGRRLLTGPAVRHERRALLRSALPLGIASLLSTLYFSIDLVLLAWLTNEQQLGVYAAAVKVLNILVVLPGTVMNAVLPGLSQSTGGRNNLDRLTARAWHWLLVIALPPCAAVALFAQPILELLFGSEYAGGASALRLLALAGIGSMLASLLNMLLVAQHMGPRQLVLNAFAFVFNVSANIVLVPRYGIDAAAAITLATEVLICVGAMVLLRRRVGARPSVRVSARPLASGDGCRRARDLRPRARDPRDGDHVRRGGDGGACVAGGAAAAPPLRRVSASAGAPRPAAPSRRSARARGTCCRRSSRASASSPC
jgi:serine O-acetyltransferase